MRDRFVAGAAPLTFAALALVPLVPAFPYPAGTTNVPTFFTTAAVRRIPFGSVVLTFPYPAGPADQPMLWQEASGFRFRLIGSYAIIRDSPRRSGAGTESPAEIDPPRIEWIFRGALRRQPPPQTAGREMAALLASCAALRRYRVQTIVLGPSRIERVYLTHWIHPHPGYIASFVTRLTGERPQHVGGVLVWWHAARSCSTVTRRLWLRERRASPPAVPASSRRPGPAPRPGRGR
jgi:hypothetical protein